MVHELTPYNKTIHITRKKPCCLCNHWLARPLYEGGSSTREALGVAGPEMEILTNKLLYNCEHFYLKCLFIQYMCLGRMHQNWVFLGESYLENWNPLMYLGKKNRTPNYWLLKKISYWTSLIKCTIVQKHVRPKLPWENSFDV